MKAQVKEQRMDCTQFVLHHGLETALEIFGEQVWDKVKLTFEQWAEKHQRSRDNQEFSAKILAKMVQTASTRDHWFKIWGVVPADSPLCLVCIEKFKEELKTLTTFDQVQKWQGISLRLDFKGEYKEVNAVWLERLVEVASSLQDWSIVRYEVLQRRFSNSDLAAKALNKMVECAKAANTADAWQVVYHETPIGSHTKQALAFFADRAETFEDWYNVWYRARDKDNDLANSAWRKVIARASTFDNWRSIFWNDKENGGIARELCKSKVRQLAKTFDDWLSIYTSNHIDGEMKADALVQMLAKAETSDDWLCVWRWTPEGSEAKAKALQKVRSFVSLD